MVSSWTGSFESIVLYASVGLAIFSILAISSGVCPAMAASRGSRPFPDTWLSGRPGHFSRGNAALTVAAFIQRPMESSLSLASILLRNPLLYVWRRRERHRLSSTMRLESIPSATGPARGRHVFFGEVQDAAAGHAEAEHRTVDELILVLRRDRDEQPEQASLSMNARASAPCRSRPGYVREYLGNDVLGSDDGGFEFCNWFFWSAACDSI